MTLTASAMAALLLSCTGGGDAALRSRDTAPPGPYGYETGIIEFRARKPFHQVEETVYFAEWGRLEARYETVRAGQGGEDVPLRHQITIVNRRGVFTWQVEERQGTRSPLTPPQPFQDYDRLRSRLGDEAAAGRLRQLGVRLLPPEMIRGFPCHVFQLQGGTFWIHRGIVLRSRIRLPGFSTSREAVRFIPGATVSPSRFHFPPGVDEESFQDLKDLLREPEEKHSGRVRSG